MAARLASAVHNSAARESGRWQAPSRTLRFAPFSFRTRVERRRGVTPRRWAVPAAREADASDALEARACVGDPELRRRWSDARRGRCDAVTSPAVCGRVEHAVDRSGHASPMLNGSMRLATVRRCVPSRSSCPVARAAHRIRRSNGIRTGAASRSSRLRADTGVRDAPAVSRVRIPSSRSEHRAGPGASPRSRRRESRRSPSSVRCASR